MGFAAHSMDGSWTDVEAGAGRSLGDRWRVYMRFAIRFASLQRTAGGFRTFSQLVVGNEWRLFNRLRMTGGPAFVSWMDSAAKRARFRQPFAAATQNARLSASHFGSAQLLAF